MSLQRSVCSSEIKAFDLCCHLSATDVTFIDSPNFQVWLQALLGPALVGTSAMVISDLPGTQAVLFPVQQVKL